MCMCVRAWVCVCAFVCNTFLFRVADVRVEEASVCVCACVCVCVCVWVWVCVCVCVIPFFFMSQTFELKKLPCVLVCVGAKGIHLRFMS